MAPSPSQLLHRTIASVLGIPEADVNENTSPDTVRSWDSVNHLNLVMALEEAFGVTFDPEETMEMTSVRLIQLLLAEKGVAFSA